MAGGWLVTDSMCTAASSPLSDSPGTDRVRPRPVANKLPPVAGTLAEKLAGLGSPEKGRLAGAWPPAAAWAAAVGAGAGLLEATRAGAAASARPPPDPPLPPLAPPPPLPPCPPPPPLDPPPPP